VAYLRIYRYFVHLTVAQSENNRKTFGYDLEPKRDFLFIWKQTLLIALTLGVYFPWAVSNISVHIIGKTYIEEELDTEQNAPKYPQNTQQHLHTDNETNKNKKVFTENDGEYIDYEEIQ
jgi:hypothetical protein